MLNALQIILIVYIDLNYNLTCSEEISGLQGSHNNTILTLVSI